jgi:hypothetical protein
MMRENEPTAGIGQGAEHTGELDTPRGTAKKAKGPSPKAAKRPRRGPR